MQTLKDHLGEVTCLQLDGQRGVLFTGSGDKTIKLWDIRTWKPVQTLKGHQNKVFCLQAQENTLVTGSQVAFDSVLSYRGFKG